MRKLLPHQQLGQVPARKSQAVVITGAVAAIVAVGVYAGADLRTSSQQREALAQHRSVPDQHSEKSSVGAPQAVKASEEAAIKESRKHNAMQLSHSKARDSQIATLKMKKETWKHELAEINSKLDRLRAKSSQIGKVAVESPQES